jgi:hypothetical protein
MTVTLKDVNGNKFAEIGIRLPEKDFDMEICMNMKRLPQGHIVIGGELLILYIRVWGKCRVCDT